MASGRKRPVCGFSLDRTPVSSLPVAAQMGHSKPAHFAELVVITRTVKGHYRRMLDAFRVLAPPCQKGLRRVRMPSEVHKLLEMDRS